MEKVQKKTTKMFTVLRYFPYEERLQQLQSFSELSGVVLQLGEVAASKHPFEFAATVALLDLWTTWVASSTARLSQVAKAPSLAAAGAWPTSEPADFYYN